MRDLYSRLIKEVLGEDMHKNVPLKFYSVVFHTPETSDNVYYGTDQLAAERKFNNFDDIPNEWKNKSGMMLELSEVTKYYDFILQDEDIEDYEVDDFYDDKAVYKFVSETDSETIKTKELGAANKNSDELLREVDAHYKKVYGKYKYNQIPVKDEKGEELGCIQLRVTDHTENIHNIDRYGKCDYHISVVIADFDATRDRFGMTNAFERRKKEYELKFNSEHTAEDIISEVDDLIEDCSEQIKSA